MIMTIGRMSAINNDDRYFTIAVDDVDDQQVKGILFQSSQPYGIHFDGLMELLFIMDRIFDDRGYPKQTVKVRCFPGTDLSQPEEKKAEESERKGRLATFCIFIQYRYHASWQGTITWEETNRKEIFESELQFVLYMQSVLKKKESFVLDKQPLGAFCVAVDDFETGKILGNYQNISAEKLREFEIPSDLAETLGQFIISGEIEEDIPKYGINYDQLSMSETSAMTRKGGKKATFIVKILFWENSTVQGIIHWREGRDKQTFRSFKEMLYLIASASGAAHKDNINEEE